MSTQPNKRQADIEQVTKPIYHQFSFKGRLITLCLNPIQSETKVFNFLQIGYSIKLKEDQDNPKLAKIIALGRAKTIRTNLKNEKSSLVYGAYSIYKGILTYPIAKAVLKDCELRVKEGEIIIKGIR